jgi:hypothetical protein
MNNTDEIAVKREKRWYEYYPLHKIWANEIFPLCPLLFYRKGDEYNEVRFGVHWLCFDLYTMSNFSFGITAELEFERIGVGIHIPYLMAYIGIRNFFTRPTMFLTRLFSRSPNFGIFARKSKQNMEHN